MTPAATPGAIIAAILLPPLGVYLGDGVVGRDFWIAVALTCLGWLPGVVWALFTVFRPRVRSVRV
jgi:uncharacterized membrane protein YqaE (UPF0057 family)